MPRKTLALIIGLVVVTVILFIIALRTGEQQTKNQNIQPKPTIQPSPTPVAHTILTLSPNPIEVSSRKQGTVEVMIDPAGDPVTGIQLELLYDPLVVSNVKVTPGLLLKDGVVLADKNDIKTGRITYLLGNQPNQDTINKKGPVATITFTVKGAVGTQSYLTLLPDTKVSAQGIANSVLKAGNGTVINIIAATPPAVNVPN